MSGNVVSRDCVFVTRRLSVEPWHGAADKYGIDLTAAVAAILSPGLPEPYRRLGKVDTPSSGLDDGLLNEIVSQ